MPQAPSLFRCFSFPDWNSSKYPKLKVAATSVVEKVISKLILSISLAHLWRHRSLDPWNRIFVFVFFLEKSTLFFFILLLPFHPLPPRFIFIACFLHSFPLSFPFSSLSLIWLQTLFIAKVMFDYILQAFNTFIDDVFAFIIVMPTAHRLACFRDDVVFVIYLYQRW